MFSLDDYNNPNNLKFPDNKKFEQNIFITEKINNSNSVINNEIIELKNISSRSDKNIQENKKCCLSN